MQSTNIVFTGPNQVEVKREPVPEPRPDELLLQTQCTLISTGTELICLERKFEPGTHWHRWVQYPFYSGYSQVGRVVAMGSEVRGFEQGDRVASGASHRQFACVPATAANLFPIPDAVTDEDAAWATLSYIVQHGIRKAQLQMGDAVVIIGLGLLGQLAVQYARLAGAGEVIAIDTAPARLEMAAAHGATRTLQLGVGDALPAVTELTGGQLADVVFDITGHASAFAPALKLLRRFGKLILIGDTGTPVEQRLSSEVIKRDLQIIGAHASNPPPQASDYAHWTQANMAQLFFKYLERGQMRVSDLVTHRYKPQQAAEAYRTLIENRAAAMGVLFDFKN